MTSVVYSKCILLQGIPRNISAMLVEAVPGPKSWFVQLDLSGVITIGMITIGMMTIGVMTIGIMTNEMIAKFPMRLIQMGIPRKP